MQLNRGMKDEGGRMKEEDEGAGGRSSFILLPSSFDFRRLANVRVGDEDRAATIARRADDGVPMSELHIDTDWKKQAQEEKRRLAEEQAKREEAAKAAAAAPPPVAPA